MSRAQIKFFTGYPVHGILRSVLIWNLVSVPNPIRHPVNECDFRKCLERLSDVIAVHLWENPRSVQLRDPLTRSHFMLTSMESHTQMTRYKTAKKCGQQLLILEGSYLACRYLFTYVFSLVAIPSSNA